MIRPLIHLGQALLKQGHALEGLVMEEKGSLFLLDLDPRAKEARLQSFDLDPVKLKRFLWVGDPPASGAQRDRVTTSRLEYLVGQVVSALVEDPGLAPFLKGVVWPGWQGQRFAHLLDLRGYRLLGAQDTPPRFFPLAPGRFGAFWVEGGVLRYEEKTPQGDKTRAKGPAEALAGILEAAWGLRPPKEGRALYSLALEGEALAERPEYRAYLERLLVGRFFEGAEEGFCHACGRWARLSGETTVFRYKFYITDKKNFAPGLSDKAFARAFALCEGCFKARLLGERFAEDRLEIPFLSTLALVLPEGEVGPKGLDRLVDRLLAEARGLERLEAWREFLARAGAGLGGEARVLGFSLIFFHRAQAATKVQEVVPEIPPSRLEALFAAMEASRELAPLGGEVGGLWELRLLLDPQARGRERPVPRNALRVALHLFLGLPLDRAWFLAALLDRTREEKPREALRLLALGAGWIWVLERLGLWRGEGMAWDGSILPEEKRRLFEAYRFGPLEAGLYLLGEAMEAVGQEQARLYNYDREPLLEAVNWKGMSLPRVRQLVGEVMDKAKYYLKGPDRTWVLGLLGQALDALARAQGGLSDREVPYYILMGYAQARARRLRAGRGGEGIGA